MNNDPNILNQKQIMEARRLRPISILSEYIAIFLALCPFAMIVNWIFVPSHIVGGGLTGICSIIYYVTSFPIWLSSLIINAVLILIAVFTIGPKFCVRTTFGFLALSFWYRVIPIPESSFIADPLIGALVGGAMFGICLAVVILANGSTGGTDIVAMIVRKYKNIPLGNVMMALDGIVILSASILPIPEGVVVENAFYYRAYRVFCGFALAMAYTVSLDWFISRVGQSVQFLIFSRHYDEIATAINHEVNRGVTVLDGTGWYSKQSVKVVTVLARKSEANRIYALIRTIDPEALVSQANVSGVYGLGFDDISTAHPGF